MPSDMVAGSTAAQGLYLAAGAGWRVVRAFAISRVDCYEIGACRYWIIENEFQSVAQRSYIIQHQPQSGYYWSDGVDIPYDFIEENIGTDYVVYTLAKLNEDGTEKPGNEKYSKNYTITEAPGLRRQS